MNSTYFFFSSRRRHTRSKRDWSSDVCSSDLDTHANGNGGGGADNGGADTGVVTGASVPVIYDTSVTSQAANRDYAVPTYMALRSTSPAQAASVGYAGSASDGLTQLD